ncbi:MAG TPA: SDR family oxidoreductase [Chloroflexia bacterium]|nr:SDR family oxidoreductase [Chloroflexia bacterium]
MPSVLITGTSTGIGAECALRLNGMGWQVFAGVRRGEDGAALREKARYKDHLTPVLLDVTDAESISSAIQLIEAKVGEQGLDGLVNNAGIAIAVPIEFLPIDELRKQLEVNVIGQVAVTQAAIPLLRTAHGRIVNIGSVSGRISTPLLGPYSVSKFAMDTLSDTLRMELRPWHIHVAYVQPSGIATPIWSKALAEGDRIGQQLPDRAHMLYGSVIGQMRERATQAVHNGMPVRTVGKAVAHALVSSRPRTRYPIGSIAIVGEVLRILPDKWRNRLIMMQFK